MILIPLITKFTLIIILGMVKIIYNNVTIYFDSISFNIYLFIGNKYTNIIIIWIASKIKVIIKLLLSSEPNKSSKNIRDIWSMYDISGLIKSVGLTEFLVSTAIFWNYSMIVRIIACVDVILIELTSI